MNDQQIIDEQIKWISSGKIGCVFASALVKHRNKIGWNFLVSPENLSIPNKTYILSIIFPDSNIHSVREWALNQGFFIEQIEDLYEGLRIKMDEGISWVQYFGPDSHVKTRQSPHPMLSFTVKVPLMYYLNVGFNGILHLAHASIHTLSWKKADRLWNQSFVKTAKELGHSPTLREAAKTTYERK